MPLNTSNIRLAETALLAFVLGCGGAVTDRCAVSGKLIGLEAQSGIISFVPESGTAGPSVRTTFASGRYAFDAAQGPKPGKYVVLVWVTPEDAASNAPTNLPLDELKARMTEKSKPQSLLATVPRAAKAIVDLDLKMP